MVQQLTSKQIRKRQRPDLLHQPNPALVAKPQPQRITRSIGETISRTAIIPIAQEGQAKLITPVIIHTFSKRTLYDRTYPRPQTGTTRPQPQRPAVTQRL